MEFCINWNKNGSTCECTTCLGPWIETAMGYWRHAFDKLLYSFIKPTRNVIPLADSDIEEENGRQYICDSPVSSISDQCSTDELYEPDPNAITSESDISSEAPSSDGIFAENDETAEPTDSESLIESTDDETDGAPPAKAPNPEPRPAAAPGQTADDAQLLFDFTEEEQKKLDRLFDSVFTSPPENTSAPEIKENNE